MHTFKVWAPAAEQVKVKVDGHLHPMAKAGQGWWQADVESAEPGSNYAYFLDGQQLALPDPRSAWQPQGVHGPSRVFDHSAFAWQDERWQAPPLSSGILYELHIGTFTNEGTLDAAIGRLDYLKGLGVSHVELLPVAAFPGKQGWGYDGVDLFAVHEPYGGPEALKRFVNAAHGKGLAVLLDVVYNHFGPSGNYVGKFGPYFTDSHSTPWGDAVNLEAAGSHEVRRFFIDSALMWLRDYHIDGLRLDAVHAYMDRSALNFMEQLQQEVRALEALLGRWFVIIAESDLNDPRLVMAPEAGGYGLDAAWSDDFHHALVTALTGMRVGYYEDFGAIADLAKSLESVYVYDGSYSHHRDRWHGRSVNGLPGWKFLAYSQNHDQVGNSAKGERLVHLTSPARAKIAAALVLTAPFVPMLFQGEEFASSSPFQYFTDHDDPELGRLVTEGRTKEFSKFGWNAEQIPDPQSPQTFAASRLDWSELGKEPHRSMLEWYWQLIRFRRATPALTDGRLDAVDVRFSEEEKWLVLKRGSQNGSGIVEVACNFGIKPQTVTVTNGARLVMQSEAGVALSGATLTLPPESVGILKVE
jgi:maltooligosyltrehalose trehalohydrolase